MTYKGLDREQVLRLPATNLQQYLKGIGWHQLQDLPERVSKEVAIFQREKNSEVQEVVVPLRREDEEYFFRRMAEAIDDLAGYEARDSATIIDEFASESDDVLHFRVDGPAVNDGTIGYDAGIQLFSGARKAVLATACAIVDPQRFYKRLDRSDANALLKASRLSSAPGSFVAKMICPLDAVLREDPLQGSLFAPSSSFTRQVTLGLMRSLQTLNKSIEDDSWESTIVDSKEHHISANLCDALLEMQAPEQDSTLKVETYWATSAFPESPPPPVVFRDQHFAIIEELSNTLRPEEDPEDSSFIGLVEELSGSPGTDGRPQGRIKLRILDDEGPFHAYTELTANDYAKAIDAHKTTRRIQIWGILRRKSRTHQITHYKRFEFINAP